MGEKWGETERRRSEQKVSFDLLFAARESSCSDRDWIVGSVYACLLDKQHK
jgi:hypothetical protein